MKLEISDIQGIIISGYPDLPFSRYLFLHVTDAPRARQWLGELAPRITTADWRGADGQIKKPEFAINIAFTCDGLDAVGLDPDALETFPQEFSQGMGNPARAHRLGDDGESDPTKWELGSPTLAPDQRIHILLIIESPNVTDLDLRTEECRRQMATIGGLEEVAAPENGVRGKFEKEHFGYRDGISQPEIEGSPKPGKPSASCLKPGEFILGYVNEYGILPPTPTVPSESDAHNNLRSTPQADQPASGAALRDLGRNGSYLVFRKLRQDVAKFRQYVVDNADGNPDLLGAKMVGRWTDGTSLVVAPGPVQPPSTLKEPHNDFGYATTDPFGYACPLGAHVRRTNPRDAMSDREPAVSLKDVARHRILRRGAPYGPPLEPGRLDDDGQPRGLLFLCINADFKRQFEFIQQTWVNNPKFHGMNNDRDPLIGDNVDPDDDLDNLKPRVFTIQKDGVRQRLKGIPRFVTTKGGAYFFLPSIPSIYFLAQTPRPSAS